MTAILEPSYQPLRAYGPEAADSDDTPQESGLIYHIAPEPGKARWNHVEDLDAFFTRVYLYHQCHGFSAIRIKYVWEVFQCFFIIIFSAYCTNCVEYGVYFRTRLPSGHEEFPEKISLPDAFIPVNQCVSQFSWITWTLLGFGVTLSLFKLSKTLLQISYFSDVKQFYNLALKIPDNELDNFTWYEVQKRLKEVQQEQQMCIHKQELTELDIYHRILRFKNYMVALVNKNLIPFRYNNSIMGEGHYLTKGLLFNLRFLLFYGPWAPFESSWHLRDDYKRSHKRIELAKFLSRIMLLLGIFNLILSPFIFIFQLIYGFFNYAELLKREPGALGIRNWSQYGRLYFRHYNELDHELNARLSRAYRPAVKYVGSFKSIILAIFADNIVFICGAILAIFLSIGLIDEDFFHVEHVITIMTALAGIIAVASTFTIDQNLVWCPESLLNAVLSQVHYLPCRWQGLAHTSTVRNEFTKFFNYRAQTLLFEIFSPFVTPWILIFVMRNQALEYVDFFRNFTVDVVGVGDVCSFALMDVGRIPTTRTQPSAQNQQTTINMNLNVPQARPTSESDHNKIELSLIHFTHTNPDWQPPENSNSWVAGHRSQMNTMTTSEYNHLIFQISSYLQGSTPFFDNTDPLSTIHINNYADNLAESSAQEQPHILTGLTRTEGPSQIILPARNDNQETTSRLSTSTVDEMNLSTLYYYQRHQRENRDRHHWSRNSTQPVFERTPLIPRPPFGH